jgi:SAM-dependent methyltransferase
MSHSKTRIARAIMTNQVARFAPGVYVRATRQTGRSGRNQEKVDEIAQYFRSCVDDNSAIVEGGRSDEAPFFADKVVLEYGPGDLPGVALLLLANGARKVYCIDRFPMVALSDKNLAVIDSLAAALPAAQRNRFAESFNETGSARSGFRRDRLEYLVQPTGRSELRDAVDVVLSRAVLEHVDALEALFEDMVRAMRNGALAVHQVDLRSHGLHESNPLDFLEPSEALWSLMFSHKGVPNRWRVDHYREIVARLPLAVLRLEPTARAQAQDVQQMRSRLASPFRDTSDEDLAWLGFWLVARKIED